MGDQATAEALQGGSSERSAILVRQRQEIKELRAKIQSMKKAVPKGDNKRRKDVNAETARLEQALQERHERELAPVETSYIGNGQSGGASVSVLEGMVGEVKVGGEEGEGRKKIMDEEKPAKKSRAQKRKEKKALQDLERQRRREEEEKEMDSVDTPRLREREKLESLLESLQLVVIDIQPDGNCLYAAIKDQLSRRMKIESSVSTLRAQCAEYIRSHSDDFLPFSTDPKTGDLFTEDQFARYCSDIEVTAAWGGQLEIRALSHVYQVTITVYQAESPPVVIGEEYSDSLTSSLTLSYHHHEYGLGEHYNSLAPISR